MKQAVENSLKRLKIDTIDLYYVHRVDSNIPIEETAGAMAELVKEGKVRYLGLSECTLKDLKKCTPAQLAIAWVMAQRDNIILIPGTKRRKYLEENAGAVDVELAAKDLEAIDAIARKYPNIGPCYSAR